MNGLNTGLLVLVLLAQVGTIFQLNARIDKVNDRLDNLIEVVTKHVTDTDRHTR